MGKSCPVKDCKCQEFKKFIRIKDIDFCLVCSNKLPSRFRYRYTCSSGCRQKANYCDQLIANVRYRMFDPLFQAVDLGLLEPVKERFISEIESIA
jgi:hypothetical protein